MADAYGGISFSTSDNLAVNATGLIEALNQFNWTNANRSKPTKLPSASTNTGRKNIHNTSRMLALGCLKANIFQLC